MFEASMGTHLRNRLELQPDLRHAIARNEMSLVYQPQAELQSGEVFGFEALVRWKHPTRGMVSPRVFIPIAEDCGAIVPIGEWVLRTACAEAARWKRPLAVAINVSAVQLHTGNLPELVAQVLEETGLDPARLELEITETSLIKDIGRAIDTLSKLKALGVQIAMDDFGTGYSSLSNLRAFPFDRIKIDPSFVRSVDTSADAAAIVHAIVGLARGLKLPVVAEGVETVEELGFLRSSACNAMQGYYLGRPSPIDAFEHYTGRAAVDAAEADVPSERRVA
jgi:EAL domain-containing protein (putative c-di-GMP-specific phosphodiesterase class I)